MLVPRVGHSFKNAVCPEMLFLLLNHLFHSILLAWSRNTLATLRPVHVVINLLPFRLINFLLLMLISVVVVGPFDIVNIVLIIVDGDPTPNCWISSQPFCCLCTKVLEVCLELLLHHWMHRCQKSMDMLHRLCWQFLPSPHHQYIEGIVKDNASCCLLVIKSLLASMEFCRSIKSHSPKKTCWRWLAQSWCCPGWASRWKRPACWAPMLTSWSCFFLELVVCWNTYPPVEDIYVVGTKAALLPPRLGNEHNQFEVPQLLSEYMLCSLTW